jgi:hypothetical protein
VRPVAFYVGPLLFDNAVVGWVFGKLVSDVAFYLCAVFSYERFNGLLAHARPRAQEVNDESVSALEAA